MREILRSLSVTRPGLVSDKVCTPWCVLHWSLHGRFMWEFYERGGLLTSRRPPLAGHDLGVWMMGFVLVNCRAKSRPYDCSGKYWIRFVNWNRKMVAFSAGSRD